MKKIKVVLCCIILCMNLGGCEKSKSYQEEMEMEMEKEKELDFVRELADRMMEKIAEALDNRDAEALKSLFSEAALKEAKDIDRQIADLMDFYQGKMTEFYGIAGSDSHTKYGQEVEKEIAGHYVLITDKEQYDIEYEYKPIDKYNADQKGLILMEIVTDATYQKDGFMWEYPDTPGVYVHHN